MHRANITLIALCFFLSGFAALVYQSAWANYFGLVFGTSHLAVATVLSAYMLGLAVGAYLASSLIHKIQRHVRWYGVLEGLIAISALMVPLLIAVSQQIYIARFGGQPYPGASGDSLQSTFFLITTFIVLLVPTTAMGATLPLLARHLVTSDHTIGPGIGFLYALNTLGAVAGVLVSGFILLPLLGLSKTVYIAVGANASIFLLILWRYRDFASNPVTQPELAKAPPFHLMYFLVMLTGILSFSLEVYWTRLLSHVMGGTSYAFAVMLASFLAGIALGGFLGGRCAINSERSKRYFAAAQVLMLICTLLTYVWVSQWVPALSAPLSYRAGYAFLALFPAAVFLGATFPLAVSAVARSASSAAACSGRVYAWNTIGAILGALLTGFYLLPALGFSGMLRLILAGGAAAAVVALAAAVRRKRLQLLGILVVGLLCIALFPLPRPLAIVAAHVGASSVKEEFYAVGRSSTVMLHRDRGFYKLASNGLSESAIGSEGMPPFQLSQKWLSGLPALARPDAKDMLIVGLGGGIALQGVPPHIRSVDAIELEPRVLDANRAVAQRRTLDPLADPRVRVVLNDARNAMALTSKRYDIVVSQPSHPWTGGASHLYTREFLALAKQRMNADAVFLQWINSQFIDLSLLRTMAATLQSEFRFVELYQPERQVLMFLASNAPLDLWDGQSNVRRAIDENTAHYLSLGMRAPEDALAMLTFDTEGVKSLADGYAPNTDDENLLFFRARPRSDGVNADSLLEAFPTYDPLLRASSAVYSGPSYWSLPYIAERLLQGNFIQRVNRTARTTPDASMKLVVDALGLEYTGDLADAETAFRRALEINPANRDAGLGLLRMHLADFAARQLSADIAELANRLTGPSRAALEGWVLGASGNFDQLRVLDPRLAAVDTRSQLYPVAVKLRVDWRLWSARQANDQTFAKEGLAILDALLPSYWNADLYLLRAACAELAGEPPAMVESYAAAISQIQNELHRRAGQKDPALENRLAFAVSELGRGRADFNPDSAARVQEILETL